MERTVPLDLYVIRMGLDVKFPAFSAIFPRFNGPELALRPFDTVCKRLKLPSQGCTALFVSMEKITDISGQEPRLSY